MPRVSGAEEERKERIVMNFAQMMQRLRLRAQNRLRWRGMFGRLSDRLIDPKTVNNMMSQRDAFKVILPDFRDFASQVFSLSKDLNFQETYAEFNNSFMGIMANISLNQEETRVENSEKENIALTSVRLEILNHKKIEKVLSYIPCKSEISILISQLKEDS
mmetsp:Transcript_14665/g.16373  ORF Transcript_14665/g.16373 Transcript_14665/m.16373 type:complete len:161 (+) Transcript_14665:19-501(+)